MNKKCENCRHYKPDVLIPCQGNCKVTRIKRNWYSKGCQFFEKREDKIEDSEVKQ